jgi:hypothetical protein
MKKTNHRILSLFICSLFTLTTLIAQEDKSDLMNIGLVMPQAGDIPNISAGHISKIETKVLGLLTHNGISSQGGGNGIVMYPKLDIYDDQDINTGMQNLKVVRVTLTLFVKQADENVLFTSESRSLSGSGKTRDQALNSAIGSINPQDVKWTNFVKNAKSKIVQYYQKMCTTIVAQAEQLSQTGQTGRALSLLLNVPKEVSCFNDVKNKSIELYKKHINRECAQELQLAKSKITGGDYKTALAIIGHIDPESSCFSEAVSTMNNAASKVDEDIRRRWEFMKEAYKDSVELEKLRINAIKDIGVAYWQSKQQTYNYLVLVR